MLDETYDDLDQIIEFLHELRKLDPKKDDKLKALTKLLKTDPVLSKHKVLIFTEYADTARYLKCELADQGFTGIDQIDSAPSAIAARSSALSLPTTTARPAPRWPRSARARPAS